MYSYFSIKDLLGFYIILFIFIFINFQFPYHLGDPGNFKIANPINTPILNLNDIFYLHIQFHRAIPNKLGGVIGLVISILILYYIIIFYNNKLINNKFNILKFLLKLIIENLLLNLC